ncbi:MAG: hypothetical protein IT539_06005 [Bradyrhizobiaceae bacterium]|nr:hypothetical protein [Bradyrhizobiaceae bacterium]
MAAFALLLPVHAAGAANDPPRAADLGPEVALASAAGPYVGRLAVTPLHGPVGTPLTVRAEGLPAGQEFALVWRTVKGNWKVADGEYHGREYTPVAYRIATVKSDRDGKLSASFIAPDDFGFAHDIVLQQGDRLFTQAGFHLDMTVRLSPESGPVGTPIRVDIKGIGWRQLQNSWLLLYDNNFTGWISSVSTGGSASFTIPATGKPGLHVLEVLHGDFTFPYRNMQQSPEPDRPRFALSFMLTPGDAVLPPPPEQQAQTDVRSLPPEGDLVVSPRFSRVGQPATVHAAGMTPGRSYELNWNTVTGNRVGGRGWEESSSVIAKANADASGRVEFRFETPVDLGGAHALWLQDGAAKKTGTHWIVPTASPLTVGRGPAGTEFKIRLKGVGWTETANIYTVLYDNNYIGYACGFNSQGDVEITLYATGEPGWHFIDLYPAIYKGKEGRPINFRLPQLTYAADHPGEDLPRFRFAFEVTTAGNNSPSR